MTFCGILGGKKNEGGLVYFSPPGDPIFGGDRSVKYRELQTIWGSSGPKKRVPGPVLEVLRSPQVGQIRRFSTGLAVRAAWVRGHRTNPEEDHLCHR